MSICSLGVNEHVCLIINIFILNTSRVCNPQKYVAIDVEITDAWN